MFISYEGCGCADGLVTTVEGELVPRTDASGDARRKQKVYQDILGRAWKTESFEWNGTSVYSAVVNSFNGRDQVIRSRQYAGSTSSENFQDTTATFDGHGRLKTSHRPEQMDEEEEPLSTGYNYNADDSISQVTDARGAVTSYGYNSRGLVEGISWAVPQQSEIDEPAPVGFEYDNAGNRTQMTDGLGTVTYSYDSLSRLVAETREFTDTLEDAPNNGLKLEYTYTIGGQLKSLKDPYGDQINYAYDRTSRLSAVTGTSFGGVTSYASDPAYRAWGGLKNLEYGNGVEMSMTFNDRLQVDQFELIKDSTEIIKKNYEYNADGRLRYAEDELNGVFDRLQAFDHMGRVKEGRSGAEARGQTVDPEDMDTELPYRQSYGFNAFGNLTQRNNLHWGTDELPYSGSFNLAYTYANNRVTNQNWQHDADGRVTETALPDDLNSMSYDAAGRLATILTYHPTNTVRHYDGDGREVKRGRSVYVEDPEATQPPYGEWEDEDDEYFIRSAVFGGAAVSEAGPTGKKKQTHVYAAGARIATQSEHEYESTIYETVMFHHTDASGLSGRATNASGIAYTPGGSYEGAPIEADPMGGNMGIETPYVEEPPEPPSPAPDFPAFEVNEADPVYVNGQRVRMTLYGMDIPFSVGLSLLASGTTLPFNSQENIGSLRQTGIVGVWVDRDGVSGERPDGTLYVETITQFFVVSGPFSWAPQPLTSSQANQSKRDCNKEAGLSGVNAVSLEAANLIVDVADKENVTDTALAVTLRFETGFYNLNNPAPNKNVNEKGVPAQVRDWDYGPFQINYAWSQKISGRKVGGFSMSDIPDAYGVLGSPKFNGNVSDNARLAARMLLASGGSEENQVKWYPGARNMPARLANYREWGPRYRKFFECWRATRR